MEKMLNVDFSKLDKVAEFMKKPLLFAKPEDVYYKFREMGYSAEEAFELLKPYYESLRGEDIDPME